MTECSSALRRNVAMLELPFRCHAESVLVEQSQLLLMTEEEPALLAAPLLLLLPGEQDDVVVVVADADDCDCPVGDWVSGGWFGVGGEQFIEFGNVVVE